MLKALAKKPEDRFASVCAFAQALQQVVMGEVSQETNETTTAQVLHQTVMDEASRKTNQVAMRRKPSGGKIAVGSAFLGIFFVALLALFMSRGVFAPTTSASGSYPPSGAKLTINDSLSADNGQWYKGSNNGSCEFVGRAYHASVPNPGSFHPCDAQNYQSVNFVYEVRMTIIKGDCGGMLFRIHGQDSNFYGFLICQDGTYKLSLSTYNNPPKDLISLRSSSAIHQGLNQSNTIAVVANGQKFDLYINGQKVDSISDSTYDSGYIGVYAKAEQDPTEVVFSDVKVWKQ